MKRYTIKAPIKHDNLLKREGVVVLDEKVGDALVASGFLEFASVDTEVMLEGSSELPSTFKLASGGVLALGDAVRTAFNASGLSADAWNSLEENERDRKILAHALLAGAVSPGEPSDPIQPGDDDRTDGSSVEGAEAGAPASAPETDSTSDVQQQADGDATPPVGETSEAPADTAAPKADAKAAKKKGK